MHLILSSFILVGCFGTEAPDTATVYFTIHEYDLEYGEALEDVKITLDEEAKYTDEEGSVKFEDIEKDSYEVVMSKDKYETEEVEYSIEFDTENIGKTLIHKSNDYDGDGFSISYPAHWIVDEDPERADVIFEDEEGEGGLAVFYESDALDEYDDVDDLDDFLDKMIDNEWEDEIIDDDVEIGGEQGAITYNKNEDPDPTRHEYNAYILDNNDISGASYWTIEEPVVGDDIYIIPPLGEHWIYTFEFEE